MRYIPTPLARASQSAIADVAYLRLLARVFAQLRPDVVFAYTLKPTAYAPLAARLAGVDRVYCMVTGLGYAFTPGGGFRRALVRTALLRMLGVSMRFVDGIVFYNDDDRQVFANSGLLRARCRVRKVNGSGVNLSYFPETGASTPGNLPMLSRLLADKGIREYAAAARMVRERRPAARFLAGPLDPNPTGISLSEVESWAADGTLRYLPATVDVRPLLEQCSVFVLPSYYREGIPRAVLEAMATGRAIITTDAPGCRGGP